MAKIWVDRLLAGTRTFEEVPASLKTAVTNILNARFDNGEISEDELNRALGIETF
ncbi:MAG: hypothetical protein IJU91_10770 [Selenomonadaceae bacterium]|nr:hypothetical protein [Selenomonadaceae bacterium]